MATTKTVANKSTTAAAAKPAAKKPAAAKPAAAKAPAKKAATAATKKPAAAKRAPTAKQMNVTPEQRYKMIAEAAYYHAERRGFTGDPVQDWIAAEAEISAQLAGK